MLGMIAAGGALGSVLRYVVSVSTHRLAGTGFPWGTLAVNVLGSLAMGFGYILLVERSSATPEVRALLLVGLLGAFTTFSTFSLETLELLEQGAWLKSATNVLASVAVCLAAAWLGIVGGRQL